MITITAGVLVTIIWHNSAEKVQLEAHTESCRRKQLHPAASVTLCTLNTQRFPKLTVAQLEAINGIIDLRRGMRVEFSFRLPAPARLLLLLCIYLYTQ